MNAKEINQIKENINDCEKIRATSIEKIRKMVAEDDSEFELKSFIKELKEIINDIETANQYEEANQKALDKIITK